MTTLEGIQKAKDTLFLLYDFGESEEIMEAIEALQEAAEDFSDLKKNYRNLQKVARDYVKAIEMIEDNKSSGQDIEDIKRMLELNALPKGKS